jgi:hypothetical protein
LLLTGTTKKREVHHGRAPEELIMAINDAFRSYQVERSEVVTQHTLVEATEAK